jgi:hypothetical protein
MTNHAAEWAFKATKAKVGLSETERVAALGFLSRSSATKTGAWPANVRQVEVGDVIHVFHGRKSRKPHPVGRFEVIRAEAHAQPLLFGEEVPSSALFTVRAGGELERLLASIRGYAVDPKLGAYTGWVVKRVGEASPAALRSFAPGSIATLVALP